MLVLTRNPGQAILMSNGVRIIYIGKNHSSQVRLGIEAPAEINIVREEIYEKNGRKFLHELDPDENYNR